VTYRLKLVGAAWADARWKAVGHDADRTVAALVKLTQSFLLCHTHRYTVFRTKVPVYFKR